MAFHDLKASMDSLDSDANLTIAATTPRGLLWGWRTVQDRLHDPGYSEYLPVEQDWEDEEQAEDRMADQHLRDLQTEWRAR
jgi:hypothetical protein